MTVNPRTERLRYLAGLLFLALLAASTLSLHHHQDDLEVRPAQSGTTRPAPAPAGR